MTDQVFTEKCSSCIFRPGNKMSLRPGRLRELVQSAQNSYITCHKTTFGQHPEIGETICRGFWDVVGERSQWIRLVYRFGGPKFVDPPSTEKKEEAS